MAAKKNSIHVNLNSKRLHDIRMARREEYRQKAQAAADCMPSRFWRGDFSDHPDPYGDLDEEDWEDSGLFDLED